MGMVTRPNEWGNGYGIVNMCLRMLVQMSMSMFGGERERERAKFGMSWEGITCEMKCERERERERVE